MDEIVIKDETDSQLLSYVILAFLFLIGLLCAGIVNRGFSILFLASILLLCVSAYLTFLYYKNHICFLRIDATSISYHETKGLSKDLRTKWSYNFKDNAQIILEASRTSLGSGGNRTDCINIIVVQSPYHSVTKRIVARLDSNTKSKLHNLKEKSNLNLMVS
jgi:hypothetical protein